MLSSIPKGMLEQQGRNANRVPKGVYKNRGKTLPDLCSVPLMWVKDNVVLLKELS